MTAIERTADLRGLQTWLQSGLIGPQPIAADEADQILAPSARLTGSQRWSIYQRAYSSRLLKCMAEQFPALNHALGEDLFADFAREFLVAYPSESYTLYELGRRFPGFLEERRPDRDAPDGSREPWIDFMVDLARFERQLFVLFDAPGHEGNPFAKPETPDERLVLQPCFALGSYRFPVAAYYHEVRIGKDPAYPSAEHSQVALVRTDYSTHTYRVTGFQHALLQILTRGLNVADALRVLGADLNLSGPEIQKFWTGTRGRWIAAGFFIPSG
ncbi:MAG: DNA-binding domain-containing protein [Acidimicrobiia bacterium]|nr:DNA-binding domain-containing protein [Acidimicrobiia bacterium]NNL28891.1 DUF2063 domain-containing protein [Acidimicrobiia bacterium]